MKHAMEWLGDDGPLVLLTDGGAPSWLGIYRPAKPDDLPSEVEEIHGRPLVADSNDDEESPSTDYSRTCGILDRSSTAALVPYEGGVALAFETSGHQATLLGSEGGLVIAKWVFAAGESAAVAALRSLPADLGWKDLGITFSVSESSVRLQVAAEPFEEEGPSTSIQVGTYAVETAAFEPDDDSSFELWRLRPLALV